MVHIQHDTLGEVVKNARQRSNLTMEELAYRLQVSPRQQTAIVRKCGPVPVEPLGVGSQDQASVQDCTHVCHFSCDNVCTPSDKHAYSVLTPFLADRPLRRSRHICNKNGCHSQTHQPASLRESTLWELQTSLFVAKRSVGACLLAGYNIKKSRTGAKRHQKVEYRRISVVRRVSGPFPGVFLQKK